MWFNRASPPDQLVRKDTISNPTPIPTEIAGGTRQPPEYTARFSGIRSPASRSRYGNLHKGSQQYENPGSMHASKIPDPKPLNLVNPQPHRHEFWPQESHAGTIQSALRFPQSTESPLDRDSCQVQGLFQRNSEESTILPTAVEHPLVDDDGFEEVPIDSTRSSRYSDVPPSFIVEMEDKFKQDKFGDQEFKDFLDRRKTTFPGRFSTETNRTRPDTIYSKSSSGGYLSPYGTTHPISSAYTQRRISSINATEQASTRVVDHENYVSRVSCKRWSLVACIAVIVVTTLVGVTNFFIGRKLGMDAAHNAANTMPVLHMINTSTIARGSVESNTRDLPLLTRSSSSPKSAVGSMTHNPPLSPTLHHWGLSVSWKPQTPLSSSSTPTLHLKSALSGKPKHSNTFDPPLRATSTSPRMTSEAVVTIASDEIHTEEELTTMDQGVALTEGVYEGATVIETITVTATQSYHDTRQPRSSRMILTTTWDNYESAYFPIKEVHTSNDISNGVTRSTTAPRTMITRTKSTTHESKLKSSEPFVSVVKDHGVTSDEHTATVDKADTSHETATITISITSIWTLTSTDSRQPTRLRLRRAPQVKHTRSSFMTTPSTRGHQAPSSSTSTNAAVPRLAIPWTRNRTASSRVKVGCCE